MTRNKVHLFGEWKNIDGVYFSNLLWDWFDDFGEEAEYRLLETGYCPYCDAPIHHGAGGYYCSDCELEWPHFDKLLAL